MHGLTSYETRNRVPGSDAWCIAGPGFPLQGAQYGVRDARVHYSGEERQWWSV